MLRVWMFVVIAAGAVACAQAQGDLSQMVNDAQDLYEAGRHEDAVRMATSIVTRAPDDYRGYLIRGLAHEAERRFGPAIDDYTLAIQHEPKRAGFYMRRGSVRFFARDIDGSIADFDKVAELEPEQRPNLWQRGISYYYARQYKECAAQFALHRSVNPDDVENSVWHYLCLAKVESPAAARKQFIPTRGDGRVPMTQIHALFAGTGKPEQVLEAAAKAADRKVESQMYAHLYLGLWEESNGRRQQAKEYMDAAAAKYAIPGHYMWEVARIHSEQLAMAAPEAASPAR